MYWKLLSPPFWLSEVNTYLFTFLKVKTFKESINVRMDVKKEIVLTAFNFDPIHLSLSRFKFSNNLENVT